MYKILIFLMLMTGICQADVYVLTSSDKSVVGLSEQDDMVVPEGYRKDIIRNKKISDITVSNNDMNMYDFSDGKFSLNQKKVADKKIAEEEAILEAQKKDADKKSALDKLLKLGLTDDELKSLFN